MSSKGQHVIPQAGKWGVRKAGAAKSTSLHSTQAEAVKAATQIAQNQKTNVYIHGKDGRIRERNSYGSASYPSKA